jgi:hypothetical protein
VGFLYDVGHVRKLLAEDDGSQIGVVALANSIH